MRKKASWMVRNCHEIIIFHCFSQIICKGAHSLKMNFGIEEKRSSHGSQASITFFVGWSIIIQKKSSSGPAALLNWSSGEKLHQWGVMTTKMAVENGVTINQNILVVVGCKKNCFRPFLFASPLTWLNLICDLCIVKLENFDENITHIPAGDSSTQVIARWQILRTKYY